MRILHYVIHLKDSQKNIHEFLKTHGYSSSVLRQIREFPDGILLNGSPVWLSHKLSPGEELTVTIRETASSENIVPTPLPLNIVYEDEDLLVLNKPAGMPVHPSQGNYDNTLANACAWHFRQQGIPFVFRCINRLDRDTSGLLILARHGYSASLLSRMTAERMIHREYLAVAQGKTPDSGTIYAPIARAEGSTIERRVDPVNGVYACTHYHRLAYKNGYSLVSLTLDTGRTHQIRVHMKHIGHPLPGDFLYNPCFTDISRQALHSFRLSFRHPITGALLTFTAPLPSDMSNLLNLKTSAADELP